MTGSTDIASAREGALDLIAHIVLRCGGRPNGSLVMVTFTGEENNAVAHPLTVVDLSTTEPTRPAAETVDRMLDAIGETAAERVALVAFDDDMGQMNVVTGMLAVTLGLPTQRLLVDQDIWMDPDNLSVTGLAHEIYSSRAAMSAVLAGVPFPGQEAE